MIIAPINVGHAPIPLQCRLLTRSEHFAFGTGSCEVSPASSSWFDFC
jgi:hypothetical protein